MMVCKFPKVCSYHLQVARLAGIIVSVLSITDLTVMSKLHYMIPVLGQWLPTWTVFHTYEDSLCRRASLLDKIAQVNNDSKSSNQLNRLIDTF